MALAERRSLEVEYRNIKIRVDDRDIVSDVEPFVLVDQGRTVVPARALAEALGARVGWDAATNSVLIYSGSYVSTTSTGEQLSFAMPAQGFRFTTPVGFSTVRPLPPQLIKVLDADRNMQASVAKLETGAMSLKEAADFYGEIIRGILPGYEVYRQTERTVQSLPALRISARAVRQDTPLNAELLMVKKENFTWAMLVVFLQADQLTSGLWPNRSSPASNSTRDGKAGPPAVVLASHRCVAVHHHLGRRRALPLLLAAESHVGGSVPGAGHFHSSGGL